MTNERDHQLEEIRKEMGLKPNRHGICVNKKSHFTHFQATDIIEKMLEFIKDDEFALKSENSDICGDKWSEVTWGLCLREHLGEQVMGLLYPTPEMHHWPDQYVVDGRIAPLDMPKSVSCPLDMRNKDFNKVGLKANAGGPSMTGCFYYCSVFQNRHHKDRIPTREQAIQLYELSLERLKHGSQQ